MKKLIILLAILASVPLFGQNIWLTDIDSSSFPVMKGKFMLMDSLNRQQYPSADELNIMENGLERKILSVHCPDPKKIRPISLVVTVDISEGMNEEIDGRKIIDYAKELADSCINLLRSDGSECALSSFNDANYLDQDFTTNKSKLLHALDKLEPEGASDYDAGFINPLASAFKVSEAAQYQKIIIFITNGMPFQNPDVKSIVDEAKRQNCAIIPVVFGKYAPECLEEIAYETGGFVLDKNFSLYYSVGYIQYIMSLYQDFEPCEIAWLSDLTCPQGKINTEIFWNNQKIGISYPTPTQAVPDLKLSPATFNLGVHFPGTTIDTSIKITAFNTDMIVNNILIKYDSNGFSLPDIQYPIFIPKDSTKEIKIRFSPVDSLTFYTEFDIETNYCTSIFTAYGGPPSQKKKIQTLKLTNPNGGENFLAGSDTVITWEGISPTDACRLEYSSDGGRNWSVITDSATGLKFNWNKLPKIISDSCLIRIKQIGKYIDSTGAPMIEWQRRFHGDSSIYIQNTYPTHDGNFLICGSTNCRFGDFINGWIWRWRSFISKLDNNGKIIWTQYIDKGNGNGLLDDKLIKETRDHGIVFCAEINNDEIGPKGFCNIWVIRLDSLGNILWEKTFYGSDRDYPEYIEETKDNGFVFTGFTYSRDYDFSMAKHQEDIFIIKLNSFGETEWIKTYGGSDGDGATCVKQTSDGRYIVTASTASNDGDIIGSKGCTDWWILKLDTNGELIWSKVFGGSASDEAPKSVIIDNEDNYMITGYTGSFNGDFAIENGRGTDILLVKLDPAGNLIKWKNYGGWSEESATALDQDNNGNIFLSGSSFSYDGDFDGDSITLKSFIFKLDTGWNIVWKKILFDNMFFYEINGYLTPDGGYFIAGDIDLDSTNPGGLHYYDGQIAKLFPDESTLQQDVSDSYFSISQTTVYSHDIDLKKCYVGNYRDSIITDFVINPGLFPVNIYTVYFSGIDSDAFSFVSSLPFIAESNSSVWGEIHFTPKKVGLQKAKMWIITQSDTLIQTIEGEGIQPQLSIQNKYFNFGNNVVGNPKDTLKAAAIVNISPVTINILKTEFKGPNDTDFSMLSGGGATKLNPGDTLKYDLRFLPGDVGRTSGRLLIYYDGVGSPATVQLFGQGVGGMVTVADDSAYAGDKLKLKLKLGNDFRTTENTEITSFKAKVRFNRTVLTSVDAKESWTIDANDEVVELGGSWDGKSPKLAEFEVRAGLGNSDTSDLIIEDFVWLNSEGNPVDYKTETANGVFRLLGVCPDGGKRLMNPDNTVGIMSIAPNPAENTIRIELSLTEFGQTELTIYNLLGEKVKSILIENISQTGERSISTSISDLSTGQYSIILRTPTVLQKKVLKVVK